MDIGDLLFRDASCDQLIPDVVVHIPRAGPRRGQVGKYQLCRPVFPRLRPNLVDLVRTGVGLAAGIVRQGRVEQPLVKCQLPAVRRVG